MQGAARRTGRVKAARANAGMKTGMEGVRLPGRLADKAGCEKRIREWCGSRGIRAAHLLLSCLALLLVLGPAAVRGEFFGYGSDWLSQHLPLAETLRSAMLDSGRLLPLYLHLGSGSSVYDFAYYGLLRPDILLGCLFPQVGMEYFLAGYSLAGIVLGTNLLFWWLRRRLRGESSGARAAAFAAALYAAATCLFHAHNQLMFVNYLPFLILTLIGIDRMAEQGKGAWLVTSGLSLVYLHSFYYSISCLAVCGIYAINWVRGMRSTKCEKRAKSIVLRLAGCVCLSIGLCAVLLLPTGLDILSGSKDGGVFAAQLKLLDLTLEGMLYTPYGMGLTLISLYCLLTALAQRKTRFLAICMLAIVTIPAVSLLLNGLLYARGKILIPFLLPILLLCAQVLCGFLQGSEKPPLWAGALCLVPWAAACAESGSILTNRLLLIDWLLLLGWILLDWLLMMGWVLWMRCADAQNRRTETGSRRMTKTASVMRRAGMKRVFTAGPAKKTSVRTRCIALLLLVPCVVSWTLQMKAGYVEQAQINFSMVRQALKGAQQRIEQAEADKLQNARWEILSEGYKMSNYAPLPQMQRTSMYSSMTQQGYAAFFYDMAGNAIPARNRVALVPGKNPLFNALMGVRYVTVKAAAAGQETGIAAAALPQTDAAASQATAGISTSNQPRAQIEASAAALPPGYEVIYCEDSYVTGRNPDALPIAFGTDRLLSQKDFTDRLREIPAREKRKLTEALSLTAAKTEVSLCLRSDLSGDESAAEARGLRPVTNQSSVDARKMRPVTNQILAETGGARAGTTRGSKDANDNGLQGKVLILEFDVTQANGREIIIDINGTRNKLSGSNAPYPNGNTHFTYILDAREAQRLHIEKNTNEYVLQNLQCRLLDLKAVLQSRDVWEPDTDVSHAGRGEVFRGRIDMRRAGFFETSYPFRAGYSVTVDGESVRPRRSAAGFLVVPLAAGNHEVQIDFLPPGYRTGLGISLLALLLFTLQLLAGEGAQGQEESARRQGDQGGASERITEAQSRLLLKRRRAESKEDEPKKHMERCQTRRNTRMKVYTQSAQLIKYIVTGGLTTGVNYLIYFILLGAAGDAAQQSRVYLAANSAAWLGAVLFAYVMNRKLVFHSERAIIHEFLEFAGLRLATLAVENLLLYLLIDVWQWQSPLAKLAVSIVTVTANYAACRLRIFRGGETKRIKEHI